MNNLEQIIDEEIEAFLDEKKKKKKKKKKKAKKKKADRCTRIAKRKYDVWPSAYASGAVVRCRKGEIWKDLKEDDDIKDKYGSEVADRSKRSLKKGLAEDEVDEDLRKWFGRKGAPGSTSGWVDCNTCRKDKKTGRKKCKSCGRKKGEKRAKYPACRPTPAACATKGKGKKWGKKSKKNESIENIVIEELQNQLFKPGLKYHVENSIPLTECIYRIGSPCYFNVIKQGRDFYKKGIYEAISPDEVELFEESDLGEWAVFEGESVPLDFPMYNEPFQEAKKKKEKGPIGKPMKNTGSGKKYKVYVRDPKTGNVRTITYGDSKGGLKGNWNNAEARKSFAARHRCAEKSKDPNRRLKPGYWACRAHKDFGKNVPGRFW